MKESHPQNLIFKQQQRLDYSRYKLLSFKDKFDKIAQLFLEKKNKFEAIKVENTLDNKKRLLVTYQMRMDFVLKDRLNGFIAELEKKKNTLDNLSPKRALEKGFAMIEKDGLIVKSKHVLRAEDLVNITFKDGKCIAEIKEY
jgi:exodeoxyribonuclease VII large subunit